MNKYDVYLDLNKLNSNQIKEVGVKLIYSSDFVYPACLVDLVNGTECNSVLHFCKIDNDWERVYKESLKNKEEISLQQFEDLLKEFPYPDTPQSKKQLAIKRYNNEQEKV